MIIARRILVVVLSNTVVNNYLNKKSETFVDIVIDFCWSKGIEMTTHPTLLIEAPLLMENI